MTHLRPQNWPVLLHDFLAARRAVPFAWGSSDCVTTAAAWLMLLGYPDPIYDLRGRWSSPAGAAALAKAGGGLLRTIDTRLRDLGALPIAPGFATRGDLGFVREPRPRGRRLLGVWETGCLYCPGPAGLVRVPAWGATHAWRV